MPPRAASLLVAASQLVEYLIPGRRLRAAGVPWSSLAAGGLDDHALAWPSTVQALRTCP